MRISDWSSDVCSSDLQAQLARSLPRTRLPDQLHIIFIHLAKPRCADRLPAGEAPAIGVDRQAAVDPRPALGDPCGLLAIGAEPVFGPVHDLGPRLRVLTLRSFDVPGADAPPNRKMVV